jgi:hypothetical protein
MPVRKRNVKRRGTLNADEQAWLGGKDCGFVEFKPLDELKALWDTYGNPEAFEWRPGMDRPKILRGK